MIVRSYSGRTVAEALAKVRTDLGEHALIIETRNMRDSGLFGRKIGYEVVAASNSGEDMQRPEKLQAHDLRVEDTLRTQAHQARALQEARKATAVASHVGLADELAEIRNQLSRLASGRGLAADHLGAEMARALADTELPDEIIGELDQALQRAGDRLDQSQRREFLVRYLARCLKCVGGIDWNTCRSLMVVGPTGVGKTTTIAKLASELTLKRKRKVALATIDTYRVGATDQLRAYADLLDIPLEVAQTPAQLARIVREFSDYDHVLIDTAGRSPSDSARVHELRGFCRAAPGISVMIAASATNGRAEFAAVMERFSVLPLEHCTVTKLDECVAPGRLLGCMRRHQLSMNYFTTGQEVPDDIVTADATLIAEKVLESASTLERV
jgi:flagellar biosynthesis protein FlhF